MREKARHCSNHPPMLMGWVDPHHHHPPHHRLIAQQNKSAKYVVFLFLFLFFTFGTFISIFTGGWGIEWNKTKKTKQKKGASGWSGEVAERHLADKTQTKFKTVGIAALHLSEDRKESGNNLPRLNGREWNGNEFKAGKNGGKDQRWSFFFLICQHSN